MSVRKLRTTVSQKFGIHVSIGQCRRAKKYALQVIDGTLVEHYAKLLSYAEEIRRLNPVSTMKLDVNYMPDGKNYYNETLNEDDEVNQANAMNEGDEVNEGDQATNDDGGAINNGGEAANEVHVQEQEARETPLLTPLKKIRRKKSERIIKLKLGKKVSGAGICKGELLCVVRRDENIEIYPIACVVVCVENKENWRWFLDLLIDELGLNLGYGYSVISDQHKAVKELLPYVKHRQCGKHISQNLRKRYSGVQYESIFWKACKATTKVDFKVATKELEVLDPSAHQYLMDKDPKTWSRAYFQPRRCCDAVENGMLESFNVLIVNARKKPIITMLEELRMYMMERVFKKKCKGPGWGNQICPTIREIVNDIKKGLRHYQVLPRGLNQFEVRGTTYSYEVDLEERTCSCRLCITYKKAYKFSLAPMNGRNLWPATYYTPPLPPIRRTMTERPATKRKRDATETPNNQEKNQRKLPKHKTNGVDETLNEDDEVNQANAMNEGDEVNEGDQATNDDGGAINNGGEAANEVHVQQDYDEVELTPLEFDSSVNGEPSQVHVQEQEARETPLLTPLKKIRRKKSERIIKLKLGKKVSGAGALENSEGYAKGSYYVVRRNANIEIYPIAWVVVCVENKENWRWFLDLLTDELGLNLGYGYSVISDQHKAVKELLPYVKHRQCGKHISQNLRKRYSGVQYESIFWKACKATKKVDFKVATKELEVLDPSAHQYLMDKDPKTWSRAYFQPRRCCDAVENGMLESFNVLIVNARKKPIITMLEELRMYMMERVFKKKCKGPGWGNQICPTIREIVNDIKKGLRHY
ncbi:unnamed protein product [Lactuca saligna]|uniref:MULE transposase domain-containing protein n=1 Tax=Lactuca saligna TaxID=75948 RepID=A0AA35YXU7_LACSI|nr:unnamed protein product [Lactuca saligna]